jgi:multicomponent Na+:H+ antiporter subunit E
VIRARLPQVAWLAAVWVLLWGTFSAASIVGGVLVGVAVTAAFCTPRPADRLPVRPLRLLGLGLYLLYDLVVTGIEVTWLTVRDGRRVRGVVLAVPLLARSERVIAVVANAFSLSPGTIGLQLDLGRDLWFVYVLGPRDRAGAERARRGALAMQRRVLAALGTPEELAAADRSLA